MYLTVVSMFLNDPQVGAGTHQEFGYLATLEAGFDAHLMKPLDLDELLAVVSRLRVRLHNRRQRTR